LLVVYVQAFPNFVLPSFVAPFIAKMLFRTRFRIVNMGGAKEGTGTTIEVDFIAIEMVTESI
jgi:hypothetical protein